jgi:hypothetical protein
MIPNYEYSNSNIVSQNSCFSNQNQGFSSLQSKSAYNQMRANQNTSLTAKIEPDEKKSIYVFISIF